MDKLRNLWLRFTTWYQEISLSKGAKKSNEFLLLLWRGSLAFLVIWIGFRFKNMTTENNSYVIKAFSVTPDMEKMGYRGETVVARMLSEMQLIINPKDSSTSRMSACRQNDKARLNTPVHIADGSERGTYDIKGIFQAVKTLLGKEDKEITGYVVNAKNQLTMFIQLPDEPLKSVSIGSDTPLDSLFYKAAIVLTRQMTPQYLANYLIQKKQFQEAELLLAELDFKQRNMPDATEQEQIQTLSNWANFYLTKATSSVDTTLFDDALQKAQELRDRFPNDIAGYAMQVSILMTKAGLRNSGYGYDNINAIKPLATQAFLVAKEAERKEKKLQSAYFDKKQVMGLMLCNAAYLANQCQLEDPKVLEKHFQKSRSIMPQSVYIYNTLAYFYAKQGNRDSAKRYINDALNANQLDGNISDSYSEIMLRLGDTTAFFKGMELALRNQRPATRQKVEDYRNDSRWGAVLNSPQKGRFKELFDRYALLRGGK